MMVALTANLEFSDSDKHEEPPMRICPPARKGKTSEALGDRQEGVGESKTGLVKLPQVRIWKSGRIHAQIVARFYTSASSNTNRHEYSRGVD